jgi:hypothetical protein
VHIETSDPNVQLHRWLLTSMPQMKDTVMITNDLELARDREFICKAPCDKIVDGRMGQEYFFSGFGIRDSERFQLIHQTNDLSIEVRSRSSGARLADIFMASSGAGVTISGISWTAIAFVELPRTPNREPPRIPYRSTEAKAASLAVTGSGVALTVTGLILYVVNNRTRFTFLTPGSKTGASVLHTRPEALLWHF